VGLHRDDELERSSPSEMKPFDFALLSQAALGANGVWFLVRSGCLARLDAWRIVTPLSRHWTK
jgi:hypothetical protein